MVMSLASRSASRMISSKDLRRISARSRGFLPAQPSKAALAASTAALASSTVALATEAILFSVAGSRTSKRPPSEDLRHLPPIHRSVGTLARRFSYMGHFLYLERRRRRRVSLLPLPPNSGLPEFGTWRRPKSDKSDFGWERGGVRGQGLSRGR